MRTQKKCPKRTIQMSAFYAGLFWVAVMGCEGTDITGGMVDVGVSRQALSEELVVNGDFSNGASSWYLGQYGGSSSGVVIGGEYKISVSSAGSEWWHVQFQQGGLPLAQGTRYTFSFDAYKGPENGGTQIMQINIGENGGDYTSYFSGQNQEVTLSTGLVHYSYTFEMTDPSDPAARVEFNCGRYTGSYYIDNVSLVEVMEDGLNVSPADLTLKVAVDESAADQVRLTNASAAAVAWSIFATEGWLSVTPSSGTVPAGGQVSVTVTADGAGLATGMYSADLEIAHNAANPASPVVVGVDFEVKSAYQPQSPYLITPELAIDFVDDTAEFRTKARDDSNGGFYTYVDRQGYPTGQNEKSLCGQSRLGYAFARAFMLTGDESYLEQAHHALKFLYDHGFNNGWYFVTDNAGNYISHWGHNDWWSFQQHYALVGITAMVEATGGEVNWGDGSQTDRYWLNTGLNSNDTKLWDFSAASGYFEYASRDWSNKWGKGFTPTVDGITTHAFLLAAMTDDPQDDSRLFALADNIVDHLTGNMSISAIGFPEFFDADWNVNYGSANAEVGHLYKTAWVLQRAYLMDPSRTSYNEAAQSLMWDLWNNGGYDKINGGPYSTVQWQNGSIVSTNKNHWMLEQGVTSGLINYYVASTQTDKDMYLEVADGSLSFLMDHMLDQAYGETFTDVSADGNSVVNADKGGLFTAGYHSVELGYYTYLYGNLYYHHRPVTLYYRYPVSAAGRSIKLTPVAIEDSVLKILAVEKDGAAYSNFNGETRTLQLPAGTGGVFKVTFGTENENICGDGTCNNGETCSTCETDCGACEFCGDGTCNNGETCSTCETDCGACEFCGDGTCNNGETCSTCETDCGACEFCGDGTCNNGETCSTCETDCGACSIDTTVWLEAEDGVLTGSPSFATGSDVNASGGEYIQPTADTPNSPGPNRATYIFGVSAGTYKVWGRVIAPNGNDDSFWVRVDGGTFVKWNNIPHTTGWTWDDVHNSDNGGAVATWNLSAGTHTLEIANRENGVRLDKIYITANGDTPTGLGGDPVCIPFTCEDEGAECGTLDDGCGDILDCGTCAIGESCDASNRCTVDEFCGDGTCNNGETCSTCEIDCGACDFCGDGTCNNGETCATCETDCGACDFCGDGTCNNGETCSTCETDCGACETCSDGIQNQNETGVDCGGVCPACEPVGCTCPAGCNAVVDKSVQFVVDGTGNTCYFFESLGGYINSWNTVEVNINGTDITNKYLGSWSYPGKVDNGYYIYFRSTVPWGHLEAK